VSQVAVSQRIRGLRPPKPYVDPFVAHGWVVDEERRPDGTVERALTIFLAGAECPFTCAFCDLWRYTIDGPTPAGALPRQVDAALGSLAGPRPDRLKLYNASNFFDRRAVPPEDLPALAALGASFRGVTVESPASTVGPETVAFARRLDGRLEVAMGLETIHPLAARRMNKRLDPARFDAAAEYLAANDIDLRVFVLLGAPHVPAEESADWAVRTVEHAVARGAGTVCVIPVRGGNGEMERLAALGQFTPPTLVELETALDRCIGLPNAVVTVDLWDAERLPACEACRATRLARLQRMNVSGRAEPRVVCATCGAS
jgi:radical SAM enzyme (TIGR01210 family)